MQTTPPSLLSVALTAARIKVTDPGAAAVLVGYVKADANLQAEIFARAVEDATTPHLHPVLFGCDDDDL